LREVTKTHEGVASKKQKGRSNGRVVRGERGEWGQGARLRPELRAGSCLDVGEEGAGEVAFAEVGEDDDEGFAGGFGAGGDDAGGLEGGAGGDATKRASSLAARRAHWRASS